MRLQSYSGAPFRAVCAAIPVSIPRSRSRVWQRAGGVLALLTLAFIVLFAGGTACASDVIISEFMADNQSTLADEDGDYSDWIELYNSSTNLVSLKGWYLTDQATNLTHWKFPDTNIGPSGFMVVFASNKNRKVPGAPLHTNFKLSKSGEYLALTMPDGLTKASEFAPAFPPQFPDISYGYVMTGALASIVAPTAAARALVPSSDIGTSWRLVGFDDSNWKPGTLGAGYDTSGSYASAIGLDLSNAMLNANASAYIRVPFSIPDSSAGALLRLSLRYDAGFVAYLNGTEVLRRNAPAALAWNSAATAAHGTPSPGLLTESFEGPGTNYALSQYSAAPGPSVQPAGANSTGKFLRLLYDGTNSLANSITFNQTAPGLFQTIVADFDFRLTSATHNPADGFAFMLIPTALYGTNGPGVNTSSQAVENPNYQGVFGLGFRVYPHTSVNDVSANWNGTRLVDVTIPTATLDLAAGVFHHAKATLQYISGGAQVTLTLTPNINGTAGVPFSPIANLFIAGLSPFDGRVQFGARTGGLNMSMDLDNCNVQFLPGPGLIPFETFDLHTVANPLIPGQNLLAIQGLSLSPGTTKFLSQPQLSGGNLVTLQPATYLYPPTPGTWNNSLGSDLGPPPVTFWPPAGVYSSNTLNVALASSSSAATIYYTLDGTTPGTNASVFTNTLALSTNVAVRAFAVLNGVPGPVAAANYILLDSSLTNFSSNLPLLIVDTLGQALPADQSKIAAYALTIETNTLTGRASWSNPVDYAGRIGFGIHGQSSAGFPKQPFKLETDGEDETNVDYPLLGLPSGNDWMLDPFYDDKTLMNDFFSYELFERMGHYSVRRTYFELFLHQTAGKLTSGEYWGVYALIEKIRIDTNRVNIAQLTPADNAPPEVTGGYIIAKDKLNAPTDPTFTTSSGEVLQMYRPTWADLTGPQLEYITNYINQFEAALYGANWLDPLTGYAAYIDVDSFVDFHWIVEYCKNIDGFRLSNYLSKDRNGKLTEGPIWDWDLSWGNANYLEGGNTNNWYYPQLSDNDDLWLRRLRTDPDFYQKIIDRWGALRLNVFNGTNLLARVDQITNLLWEAQARDFARWPRLGTYIWPNPNGAAGGFDVDYVSPTTYAGLIAQFKKFILGRYLWIDGQFVPAPLLATNGAQLTLSAPLGSIYYTLDGTDPRASGGGVANSARLYSGTVTLTNNAAIVARAFYTNAWSASAQALVVLATPPLRITEIMYNPAPPPTNSPYQAKDFEFVEVQNTGTNVINLAGVRITGGINFTFAPTEWVEVGAATTNDFEGGAGATPYFASTLGSPPSPHLTNDGPSGTLLCLLNSTTNTTRNRIAFNQTSTGACSRVVADFDFRAATAAANVVTSTPTVQDFDTPGTAYTLSNSGTIAPAILPADSDSTGNFLRLVPASGSQMGVMAFNRSAPGAFNSVVATFDFRITPSPDSTPADGMGFALLSTAAYGTSGAGPFFAEEPNLASSIGIGFDVYANAATPQEPNNNHISLHWNGAQIGNAFVPSFTMANGRFHRAQILIWFSGNNAYVTVRLTPDINGTPGPTETVLQNVLIPGAAAYQSRVALGARTGGAWASHDVDNINVQFGQNLAGIAGVSLLFLPAAQFGSQGAGTSLSTFTDWPLVTNTLALDLAFNPSNLANDVSLYWNQALVRSFSLPLAAIDLKAGVFHHARLQLDATSGGAYATATLTPNSLGAPGTPVTVLSNQFIAGLTLGSSRLEFAGRNGGLSTRLDLDNVRADCLALAPLLLNPGESIVVVHNAAAFTSRYGAGVRIAGQFSGSLANEGEELSLLGPLGEPILDFSYDPAWYPVTDGGGFSLVTVDPAAPTSAWGQASNWRPSSELGGSPGISDPPPPAPALTVTLSSSGPGLTLAWPAAAGNFALYRAAALALPSQWAAVTNTPELVGSFWIVNLDPGADRTSFYRLQAQ